MANPPLPPGFVLESPQPNPVQQGTPALPPGFEPISEAPRADFSDVRSRVQTYQAPPSMLSQLGRQAGLFGRNVIRAGYGLSGIVSDPITQGINAVTGGGNATVPRQATAAEAADYLADRIGLPREANAAERIGGGITQAVAGGGGLIGLGRGLARQGAAQAPTVATRIGELLQSRPGTQVAGAALGSGASEVTREAGGGPVAQAVAGAAGSVLPGVGAPIARMGAAPVAAPFQGVTQSGADNAVADILRRGATNTENLFREAPSAVPGVTRSLAEETLDPGVAALQRQYGTGPLREQAQAANQARVEYIGRTFGAPAAAQAARDEGDALARQTVRSLRSAPGQAIDNGQLTGLADTIASRTRRPEIVRAVEAAKGLVAQPFRNAADAWDARQGINDLIAGKVSDLPSSNLAQKQLLLLRGALDRQMRRAYPGWSKFLRDYQGLQRSADRVEVGQTLLERGGVTGLNAAGEATTALSPAKFRNLTDNLDQLAQTSTGFRKATAANLLTDDQVSAIQNVRDDILRLAETQRTGFAGSPTQQNRMVQELVDDAIQNRAREILASIPGISAGAEVLSNVAKRRIELRLQQALANPAQAREILRNAPAEDLPILQAALQQTGATTSTLSTIEGQ